MEVRKGLFISVLLLVSTGWPPVRTSAQVAAPPQPPKKASTPARVKGPMVSASRAGAPQVVTIVHRLNGLKMFRLLLRAEEQVQAFAGLNDAFKFTDDVHTNVIAGLAMDDGQTIVVWLPEAEVELGPMMPFPPSRVPFAPMATPALPSPNAVPPLADSSAMAERSSTNGNSFETPDLTVIGSDGKQMVARFVGLDGVTGLSILKLADKNLIPAKVKNGDDGISEGQDVRLFGPEPVTQTGVAASTNLYVRIGETQGTIFTVTRTPAGGINRFKVRSPRLTLANIGGVAVNDAGDTVGIVNSVDGTEATVLPAALIQLAAKRVLARQSSVPKPWLGVRGEPVAGLKVAQIVNHGWQAQRATALAEDHCGILLTWIAPGSPAALATLRAGDVILKVNDEEIETADDFSWMLGQAGPSSSVRFTVARQDTTIPEAINIKLSASLDPTLDVALLQRRFPSGQGWSLINQGIETITLRSVDASRLGSASGLLIVYVQPSTPAFKAGLRPGDVIEAIDGKQVSSLRRPMLLSTEPGVAHSIDIVRKRQKLIITVINPQ
jgi:S1-C subfamily serine protease